MPQPSVSGMEPPFGDAFQNYSFVDQALTSTELLATSSDPDFMYELDRDMSHRQSPCGDNLSALDGGKEAEGPVDQLMALGESESVCSGSAFEQWDSYWEDLTRYTRLTSCDIWGTKEVDFLGLDDFSSPYQDEEVISRTPTLAQLNSEDSQPVCETLCPPTDLSLPPLQPPPPVFQLPAPKKRPPVSGQGPGAVRHAPARLSHSLLPDVPEGPQRPTRPVASSTDTMSKTQVQIKPDPEPTQAKQLGRGAKAAPVNTDFVRKAKVRVSSGPKTDVTSKTPFEKPDPVLSRDEKASTSSSSTSMGPPSVSVSGGFERHSEGTVRSSVPLLVEPSPTLDGPLPGLVVSGNSTPGTGTVLVVEGSEKSKEEEHNYSLFLTRSRLSQRGLTPDEDEEDDEEEEEEEVEEEEEGLDDEDHDEDHDEGFGSDHELLSENEEEDDDDDDYEADKDDDMSDAFSEPGCDVEMEDIKGLTAGVPSRKRGKRRYFWEYSEQLTPSKQERMLKPSEWDRHTLPSNLYQKNGPLHGKYMLKKSRRTDVEDLTPNPRKLLQIGTELRKLNKVISDLTPVSELPINARPRSRKEKNKLASRACRLKKKAQYEANKVKLWGLSTEYDRLLFVINSIKEEIVSRVEDSAPRPTNMTDTLDKLIQDTLVSPPVAGQTSDFVNKILENTGRGDPTGGLVGLRVPTSKM
ncbi:CREB3 regulatory factor [Periophthalmus magnuspinnatus]|uniref:CREB3 regulatory factor n=1 Tax=Periophthalmus magnuspinnatus TaxID=409849 RepID=UPI00145B4949|nr:CREB3 regulatory factor [Periophthalmus magnuspinnatus]